MHFENTNSAELPNATSTVNASASSVQPNVTLGDNQSGRNYVNNSANNFAPNFAPSASNSAVITSVPQSSTAGNRVVNFNLQQPYYQTTSYTAPSLPSMGTGVPYGPVSNMYPNVSPQHVPHAQPLLPELQLHNNVASMQQTSSLEPPQNFKDQIANVLRELGLEPKGKARAYQKPYLEYVDSTPYPRGFKIPDFVKFTGEDGRSTFEHIGQFLAQISEVGTSDVYKLKLFPLSLSGTAFTWFSSLAPKSIVTWAQLEQKFHEYFYSGETELRLTDLILVKQKYNESVSEYIRRFRDVKNRCFSLIIAEKDLADIAFSGLLAHIKDRLEGQEFSDINQVLQKALAQENRAKDVKQYSQFRDNKSRDKEKPTVNVVGYDSDSASDDDVDVCIAEWVQAPKSKLFLCAALKPTPARRELIKCTFDVSKCDKIFDILLQANQI